MCTSDQPAPATAPADLPHDDLVDRLVTWAQSFFGISTATGMIIGSHWLTDPEFVTRCVRTWDDLAAVDRDRVRALIGERRAEHPPPGTSGQAALAELQGALDAAAPYWVNVRDAALAVSLDGARRRPTRLSHPVHTMTCNDQRPRGGSGTAG